MMNNEFDQPQSQLSFFLTTLGGKYALLLMLSALVAFLLTLLLVIRGKGSTAGAAMLLVVPLSMFVGAYGALDAIITSLQAVASSPVQPRPSVWPGGLGPAGIRVIVGMFLAGPTLVLATFGSAIRAWLSKDVV